MPRRSDFGKNGVAYPGEPTKNHSQEMQLLNAAGALGDLALPPGNRLEWLRGDREGQHSIRINDQYRLCFEWRDRNAYKIEIADYH
jgi:proteic killer suppression protein